MVAGEASSRLANAPTDNVKAHHRRTSSLWVPPSRPAFSNPAPIIRHKAERSSRALKSLLPCGACCCAATASSAAQPEFRKVLPNHKFDSNTPRYEHPNRRNYADNRICTTKYTLLTFLPKNLFEQFHRAANLYFIFIVILNMTIGAFGRYISMIPITFVLMVTAVKDAFEDYRRYKSDVKINHSTCRVWDNEQSRYRKMEWRNVLVGDFVHLSCNEIIPADILLLRSSDENGICYVETSNLDGESSLKQRQIIVSMGSASVDFTPRNFTATVYCEQPNNQIYRFNGYVQQENGLKEPVSKMNLLLRGCGVRNTDFVEGIVLYAGRDTKAMLNNSGPRYKRSELERLTNWDIIWCVLILLVMCFTGAIFSAIWLSSFADPYRVPFLTFIENIDVLNPELEGFINFWSYVIVLQVMIPISLYVSIEIIKLGQIYLISQDVNLYHESADKRIQCRALNIPEELGQVQFVMSDKTGTLTENQMKFRRCYVAECDYGTETSTATTSSAATSSSSEVDHELLSRLARTSESFLARGDLSFEDHSPSSDLMHFFINMAICNTVVVNAQPHQDHLDESGFFVGDSFIAGNSTFHLQSPTSNTPPPRALRGSCDVGRSNFSAIPKVSFACTHVNSSSALNEPSTSVKLHFDGTTAGVANNDMSDLSALTDQPIVFSTDASSAVVDFHLDHVHITDSDKRVECTATSFNHSRAADSTLKVVASGLSGSEAKKRETSADEIESVEMRSGGCDRQAVHTDEVNKCDVESDRMTSDGGEDVASEAREGWTTPEHEAIASAPSHSSSVPEHLSTAADMPHPSLALGHLLGGDMFRLSSSKLLSLNFSKLYMKGFKLSPLLRFKKAASTEDQLENEVVQNPIYEAESPDELALVQAASDYGIRLCSRHLRSTLVQIVNGGHILKYKVLHVLPFDSDRKRMSVVVRDRTGRIIVYCKGADSAILPVISERFSSSSRGAKILAKADEYISLYASCGLRTLCLCKRLLSEEEYTIWKLEHNRAEMALDDRDKRLSESAHRIENELELLGVSAIEDRLQDGVPECIDSLRRAGISVWVLTGDKIETAVNIAYASKLFSPSMELIQLSARSESDTGEMLDVMLERMCREAAGSEARISSLTRRIPPLSTDSSHSALLCKQSMISESKQFGVVISGATLAFCLLSSNLSKFLRIVERSSSVLCCRATPLQKASVVKLVKEQLKGKVLAIGDGANDVSMIQCADVGVGISGQEGMQAVMASDFAFARFRFLSRLLLVHGHWCYYRLALIILYFFYKNALFVFVLFWCQVYNGFSAQVPIDPIYLMVYNLLFTSVPSLLFGMIDQNASGELLLKHPFLYAEGRCSKLYRWYSFWVNMLDALWQSAAIYFTAHLVFDDTDCEVWKFGFVLCTQLLFVNSFHFAILVNLWTSAVLLSLVLSMVAYFVFALIYNAVVSPSFNVKDPPVMVADFAVCDIRFWLVVLLSGAIALAPRMVVTVLMNTFYPSAVLRERMRQREKERMQREKTLD
uniref:Phospholipid-transporting ATPase n=1 Tax=Parascaris univalens TaxID=6257 RepID=A0A915AR10_PARUN